MPRKAAVPAQSLAPNLPTKSPAVFHEEQQAAERHAHRLRAVEEGYGLDMPYSRESHIYIARQAVRHVHNGMFGLGCALIQLKEHEPHGDFGAILHEIGVGVRYAQNCMQLARTFKQSVKAEKIADRLTNGQLMTIMRDAREDVDSFVETGAVAGLTLDDVADMTPSQLREALRKERAARDKDRNDFEFTVKDKNNVIDHLRLRKRGSMEEQANALWPDIEHAAQAATTAAIEFEALLDEYRNTAGDNVISDQMHAKALNSQHLLRECVARLRLVWGESVELTAHLEDPVVEAIAERIFERKAEKQTRKSRAKSN